MTKKFSSAIFITAILLNLFIGLVFTEKPVFAAEDSISKALKLNKGCLRCHGAQGLKTEFNGKTVSLYIDENSFYDSMHGTMPCIYCHRDISDYPHNGAATGTDLVNRVNGECARCHKVDAKMYAPGIHNELNSKLGKANATCSDCHGVHNIFRKEDKRATINHNSVAKTCSKCHEEIMESYEESFHGKSVYLGGKEAASCVSCHGNHSILKAEAATSPVSTTNVTKTCGKCHIYDLPNAGKGKEHFYLTPKDPAGAPMFYTLMFFTWLTIIVVTFLLLHMEMELYRRYKNADKKVH